MNKFLRSKKALPAFAIFGVLLMIVIVKLQPEVAHNKQASVATPVSVIEVSEQQIRPAITGFGAVSPDKKLQGKAEVSGRITYMYPELKKGALLTQGTVLLRIDDKDYQLALKQAQADLLASEASVEEMHLTIANNDIDLKLAEQKLAVRQKEYERLSKLRQSGAVSQSKLDAEKQNLLQQQQEVLSLKNRQNTLPSQLAVLQAKIDIAKAKVERSQRDLTRTEVVLPFNARITSVYTEQDQFVTSNAPLFDAIGIDKMLVNAQFALDDFSNFISQLNTDKLHATVVDSQESMSAVLAELGLTAEVKVLGSNLESMPAKVERFADNIDAQTRTAGVIVSVADSYKDIRPGERVPMLEGMYMQVTLKGKPQRTLAVPRFAMHQQQLYLLGADNTLKRAELRDVSYQGNLALIHSGVAGGSKIITSDLFPAVNGMTLMPSADTEVAAQMTQWLEDAR